MVGKIRAIVLKFAATKAVDAAMTVIERNVEEGPVVITEPDPATWQRRDSLAGLKLPKDRPAKVLLLLHRHL